MTAAETTPRLGGVAGGEMTSGPGGLGHVPLAGPDLARLTHALAGRITASPDDAGQGLVVFVLGLADALRRVMEQQAVDRFAAGDLSDEQAERVGLTLRRLEERMAELCDHFAVAEADLNPVLGPWSRLGR